MAETRQKTIINHYWHHPALDSAKDRSEFHVLEDVCTCAGIDSLDKIAVRAPFNVEDDYLARSSMLGSHLVRRLPEEKEELGGQR